MDKIVVRKTKPKLPPYKVIDTVNRIRSGVSKLNQKMVPAPVALMEMITGSWLTQAISVVAKLGVADHIDDRSVTSAELASKVGAHPDSLYRVLRALTNVGLFQEEEDQAFALTPLGRCLRTDHPQSMRFMAIFQGQVNWSNWGALEHCVRTGGDAVRHVHGESGFEYLTKNPEKAEIFDRAMTNVSKMELDSILAAYDFSEFNTLADVGGGHGQLLGAVLGLNPSMKGMLYDLPHVIDGAVTAMKSVGLESRVDFQRGSFFESVPGGADAYMMKHIIHDWSDSESVQILKNIRAKIPNHGKLLLIEAIIPERNVPHVAKFLDLEMLVVTTGKERTTTGFRELLAKAGFKLDRVVPTISMANVIEASPS